MSASTRPRSRFFWVSLTVAAVTGLLAIWGLRPFLTASQEETPTLLASVPLPGGPCSLAWSPDGTYLAAGAWGRSIGETGPGEVYVVDVAQASVMSTLKTNSWVEGVAFSPDQKWLAVATRPSIPAGAAPELILFDVPAFSPKFAAKSEIRENGFIDLTWSPDSKALHAIEAPVDNAQGKAKVRRWLVPAFTEQPVNRSLDIEGCVAIAASPDGRTLAFGEVASATNSLVIRLFDLNTGEVKTTFTVRDGFKAPRLGFTTEGKAVGVFDTNRLSWWDVATGHPASKSRFAVQPAGLSHMRSWDSVSPDGAWQARGQERHRGLGDLGWDNRAKEFGAFVDVTEIATGKTRTWRVGDSSTAPPVAFSPDGTKLAGAVKTPSGASMFIWAAPK